MLFFNFTEQMSFYQFLSKFYKEAAKRMCCDCQNFIEKGSKILDLGCGSGIVAKTFQDFFQAEIVGVDIQDKRIFNFPFKIIDGKNLPFSENSFNVVLISYVLHHSYNPISLLKEAKRVTKNKIIIYEDLPEGFLSNLVCKIHGFTFNQFLQNKKQKFDFKKKEEWQKIFENLNLKIIFEKKISNLPKKTFFVLKK